MEVVQSFAPICRRDAVILILGSMPGAKSLAEQQYYAHPQNSFWPIMESLFSDTRNLTYTARQKLLLQNRVALWDVLQQCQRAGSLDANINKASEVPNDFESFFRQHRDIQTIAFNGGKAETAFKKHVLKDFSQSLERVNLIRLPSTSPAHATRSFSEKLAAWRVIKEPIASSA